MAVRGQRFDGRAFLKTPGCPPSGDRQIDTPPNRPVLIARRADVRIQTVGRESILRDPRSMRAHVINGSAARIWELCDGRTLDEVVDAFSAAFDSPPPSVREDVAAVIESFRGLDLLQ